MKTRNQQCGFDTRYLLLVIAALAFSMFAIATSLTNARAATADCQLSPSNAVVPHWRIDADGVHIRIAQDDEGSDDSQVPPDQVKKYIDVYKSMHNNRAMTAEQAAAKQGMTLAQFRDLENRIERDDSAREHVRDALQQAAKSSPYSTVSPSATPPAPMK